MEIKKLKIDKKIPIPEKRKHSEKLPFEEMEIGDSVAFPVDGKDKSLVQKKRMYIVSAVRNLKLQKRLPETYKITASLVEDVLRVWRIA